jgi:hypothetical protein
MILLLLLILLLALPILGLIAVFAAPLIGLLAFFAAPAIVLLAVVAAPALAIAGLSGAFSNANVSVPALQTLEVLGIAVGVFGVIAALAYGASRLTSRTPVPALRPQEVPVRAREQNRLQTRRQTAVSMTQQAIPADLAAQCQGLQSVPCPV